jgi:hypothetical protein
MIPRKKTLKKSITFIETMTINIRTNYFGHYTYFYLKCLLKIKEQFKNSFERTKFDYGHMYSFRFVDINCYDIVTIHPLYMVIHKQKNLNRMFVV